MTTNPKDKLRYKHDVDVLHIVHGWGKTIHPKKSSSLVDVRFGEKIITVNESELKWVRTYADKCLAFGALKLTKKGGITWLHSANPKLKGLSPHAAIEAGKLDIVEKVFDETFT